MKYLSTARDIIIIFTTIITAFGIYIKTLNKLSLDIIKNEYKMIPGEIKILDVIIKVIIYIGFIIQIISLFLELFKVITNPDSLIIKDSIPTNVIQLIAFIIALAFTFMIVCTTFTFFKIKDELRRYNKNFNISLRSFFDRNIEKFNYVNIIIELIFSSVSIILLLIFIKDGINYRYVNVIVTVFVFGMIGVGFFVITNSLLEIIKVLKGTNIYYLITQNETIVCRFFLECEGYYLIIEENERYIKKGEIKEIKVIKK